jgi:glycosyltransferase involved in cell wall biosynthesis
MAKILHLIGKFDEDSGGAQRVILDIINTCKAPDLEMGVCSLFGEATLSKHLPENVFNVNFNYSVRYNPKIFFDLYRVVTKWKPDILHVHSSVVGIFGRPIAKISGIRLVCTVHNDVRNASKRNKIIDKLTIGFSDTIVCVSQLVEESITEAYGRFINKTSDMVIISNCLDCETFRSKIQSDSSNKISGLGFTEDRIIVGTVGRLHPLKGQKYLIKAWAQVAEAFPEAVLLIVGDGQQKADLKRIAEELSVGESVHFLGARNDVPEILNRMDLFVFPSTSEGLGVALLEAMCMEKVIIASDIKPLNQIVGDSVFLVPPENADQLSKKIIDVLDNFKAKKNMGIKARKRVEKYFSPAEFGRKYLSVYKKYI